MDFKQDLLRYGQQDAATLTEEQRLEKIDKTISSSFAWVGWLLVISFGIAYAMATGALPIPFTSTAMWASWIAGLGIIFFMGWKWQSLSYHTMAALLIAFAVLEWYWLTGVFYAYDLWSIYNVFLSAGAMFLVLSVVWYKTDIDIVRVWPILFVALIWLIVAMLVNSFILQNAQFDIWISVIWLIIFAGFIIYDMNVLKQQALMDDRRVPLLIALGLFINFINIFLFLLRLMWND